MRCAMLTAVIVGGLAGGAAMLGGSSSARAEPEAAAAASLRPIWTPGAEATYVLVQDTSQRQAAVPDGPKGMERDAHQEITWSRRVVDHSAAGTTLELRVTAIKVEFTVDGRSAAFDSTSPTPTPAPTGEPAGADDTIGDAMRRVIGVPITVVLGADGEVKAIRGNESADADKQPYPQTVVGDAIIRDILAPMYRLPSAPAQAVVGQRWDRVDRTPAPPLGTLLSTASHTVRSVAHGRVSIDMTGRLEMAPAVGPGAIRNTVKDQSLEGACVWDSEAGTLESCSKTEKLRLDLESKSGPVPLNNRTATTIRRVPNAPAPAPAHP